MHAIGMAFSKEKGKYNKLSSGLLALIVFNQRKPRNQEVVHPTRDVTPPLHLNTREMKVCVRIFVFQRFLGFNL